MEEAKLNVILEKMDNIIEQSEVSPQTRTILKIFQDVNIIGSNQTIGISLFDEFNNEV